MKKKIWHFSKRTTVWVYRLIETVVAFFLVTVSLAFWKLYTEPMDAKFLLPTLSAELLPANAHYSLDVDSAELSAGFQRNGLFHLNMRGLKVLGPDGHDIIRLPVVNLSYGLWHIITLNYIPDKLVIEKPDIRLVVDEQGVWKLQKDNTPQRQQPSSVSTLPDMKLFLKHMLSFDDIEITDGVLMVEDLSNKDTFSLPQFELQLRKRYGFYHVAYLTATAQMADHLTDVKAKATYSRFRKNLNLELGVTPLYLSRYTRFFPLLQGMDIPVSVSLSADFTVPIKTKNFSDSLKKMKFQLKSLDKGSITMPSPIQATYFVQSAEFNGAVSAGFKTLKIAESQVLLDADTSADLTVVIKGLNKFLNTGDISSVTTSLESTVKNVPMENVTKVWPKEQGTDAHTWVQQHLSKGQVTNANFKLSFKGSELLDVLGVIHVTGATVDYLPQMPYLEDVAAEVILTPHEVRINADDGHAGQINLLSAALIFDLDKTITDLSIDLKLAGPISEMLQAINKEPLALLSDINFDWKNIKGSAQTQVKLLFPLDEETLTQNLKVEVSATSEDAGVTIPHTAITLEKGTAYLFVNNNGLQLEGTIAFHEQPLHFVWQEDFTPEHGTNSSYQAHGQLTTQSLKGLVPDIEKYISGSIVLDASLQRLSPQRLWQGDLSFDLKNTKVVLHPIATTKKKNEEATLNLSLKDIEATFKSGTASFIFNAPSTSPITIQGSTTWGDTWQILLENVQAPTNDFEANIKKTADSFILNIQGSSWNLSRLTSMPLLQKNTSTHKKTVWTPHISLKANLKKLNLNPKKTIKNIIINGERNNNSWKYFQVEATANEPFVLVYNPEQKVFQGEFPDLGALISYLGISDQFLGGRLQLLSKQDESGLIQGTITVDKTELNEPGFLLQALSILGLLDAIRGKNMVFNTINIPFQVLPEGELKISEAYAAGANLGITFNGFINFDSLDISGAVIPAYALNSLPGKIPLIGALFREGDGGGLISLKYSVKGSATKPEVKFHPLSSIAPGALGYIF